MSFKEEIKQVAESKVEPIKTGSIKVCVSDSKVESLIQISLYWNSEDNEFEYVYSGNKTMFRWLKGKGYTDYCKTPKKIKELYEKVKSEKLGIDI